MTTSGRRSAASRSPIGAAFLSFLVPGLGQAAVGAVRRGVLLALPAATVLGAAVVAVAGAAGGELWCAILRPETLVALLVLNIVLGGYHVAAVVDAYLVARDRMRMAGRGGAVALLALAVATFGLHGALEVVGYGAYDALQPVFVPPGPNNEWAIPEPSVDATPMAQPTQPHSAGPSGTISTLPPVLPAPSPSPTPRNVPVPKWAADGRLNMLLIGSDAGPDRWSLRTDTMIVLSVDVKTARAALFGVPRNLVGVPLPPESAKAFRDGRFPGLLNALYVYAMGHPAQFPGGEARGFRAVTGAVQELVGVRLDSVVVVNLAGFVRLVDALGGLWINIDERVVDADYPLEDGSGHIRIDIQPGCQRLSGRMALAYARSRHQDSDYGRMDRQQAVLVALARQVDPVRLVPKVPELLTIARTNLWMTVSRADIGGIAQLAQRVNPLRVRRVLFDPPDYPSHLTSAEIARIQRVVRSALATPVSAPSRAAARACP